MVAMQIEPEIRPEDWVVVPPAKPVDVYNIDTDLESHLMCPSLAPAQYTYLMSIEDKFMTDVGFLSRTKIDSQIRVNIINWITTVHRSNIYIAITVAFDSMSTSFKDNLPNSRNPSF